MTTDPKRSLEHFYSEVMAPGDVERIADFIHPDCVNHAAPPGSPQGIEGVRQTVLWLAGAFSDQRYEPLKVLADGDTVVYHCRWSATHTGEFMGIPATGRQFSVEQVHLVRYADGLGIEHWAVRDDMGMMGQLGVLPSPGGAS